MVRLLTGPLTTVMKVKCIRKDSSVFPKETILLISRVEFVLEMYCFGLSSLHSPFYCSQVCDPDLAISVVYSLAKVFSSGHMTQVNPTGLNLRTLIVTI